MRSLWLILLLLVGGALYGITPVHQPLQRLEQNQPVNLNVLLEDQDADKAYKVVLFYRTKGESNFLEAEFLELIPGAYNIHFLPLIGLQNTFEYFIRVYEDDTPLLTLPQDNASQTPYSAPIIRADIPQEIKIRLLTPEASSSLEEHLPVIVFGLDDPGEDVVLENITLTLNGNDISKDLLKTRSFLTYSPKTSMDDGTYTLRLTLPVRNGIPLSQEWSFGIKHSYIKESAWKFSGNFQWNNRLYSTDKASNLVNRFPFESQLAINTQMTSPSWNTQLFTLLDNRESRHAQPLHRFQLTVNDVDHSKVVVVGDATPKLTNLTLNGKLVRGIDAEIDALRFAGLKQTLYLRFIAGNTRRALAISTANNILSGTYKQTVAGVQGTYKVGRAKHQLTYLHFKDDYGSLSNAERGGTRPQENHVFSLQNQFRLFDVTQINWENAGSIFYGDTQSAEVPLNELDTPLSDQMLKKITTLFPPRSSFLFGAASHLNIQTPLPVKGLSVISDVKLTQPGFTTLGNSGIPRDNFEYGGVLSYRLMQNRLQLRYGLKSQHNNVLEKDTPTLYTATSLAQLNYRFQTLGSFSIGYNHAGRLNRDPNGNPVTGSALINNNLVSWTFNYNALPIKLWKLTGNLSGTLSFIGFEDASNSENDFASTSYGATLATGSEGKQWTFGFNESDKREQSSLANNTIFTTYSTQYSQSIWKNKASVFTGARITNGRNTGINPDRRLNTDRLSLSTGGSANFTPFYFLENGKFTFSAEYVVQSDKLDPQNNQKNFNELLINFQYSAQF